MVDQIIAMERQIHLQDVFFIRARVGAYLPSVSGYDPFRFFNIPIGLFGQKVRGGVDPADLELCWKISRTPATGNPGMINYRGVLTELETSAAQTGKPKLSGGQTYPNGELITYMKGAMAPYLGVAPNVFLAMIGEYRVGGTPADPIWGPSVVRRVSSLSVFGAGRLKLTKRSYQRPGVDVGDLGGATPVASSPITTYNYSMADEDSLRDYDWQFDDPPPPDPI
jgi:hypothetical protein